MNFCTRARKSSLPVEGDVQRHIVPLLDDALADRGPVAADLHVRFDQGDLSVLSGHHGCVRRVAAFRGQDAGSHLDGLYVFREGGGQAEDELGVPPLLLRQLVLFQEPFRGEEDSADCRARSAGDPPGKAGQAFHR